MGKYIQARKDGNDNEHGGVGGPGREFRVRGQARAAVASAGGKIGAILLSLVDMDPRLAGDLRRGARYHRCLLPGPPRWLGPSHARVAPTAGISAARAVSARDR